jgi:hypothetical protein
VLLVQWLMNWTLIGGLIDQSSERGVSEHPVVQGYATRPVHTFLGVTAG